MLYHRPLRPALFAAASTIALAIAPAQASAQDEPAAAQPTPAEDDLHDRRLDQLGEIVVTVGSLEQLDVLAGTTVVEGAELQRELDGQVGDVLAKQAGVSATSFSPGASRPILRGFGGNRVRVLVDGIGAIDVSDTSADHAVSIDPLTLERIDILRGPAVLLYGGEAIGGAVNVIDKRIPRRRLDKPFHLDALAEADTAANLRSGGGSIDARIIDGLVFHLDGSYRNTDDIDVPGFTVAPQLRAELLAEAAEEEAEGELEEAEEQREAAGQRGFLPNSATETWSVNGGFGLFRNDSSFGAAFGVYDTLYGVPGRPGTGHAHGEEGEEGEEPGEGGEEGEERVTIDLRQHRGDFRGALDIGDGFFSQLVTRVGFSNYTHTEFEGDEVGTVFDVSGLEARAELVQNPGGSLRGSLGTQYYYRDFRATGEEAFVAPNETSQFALFALQEIDLGGFDVEGAARYETTDVDSAPLGIRRSFDNVSGALSLAYETADTRGLRIGVTGSRAARAPSGEELYSNGPHIATQAFEIGDPTLKSETAWGLEGFVRGTLGPAQVSFAIYKTWFDDYIYQQDTGAEEDDLPVFRYFQRDADYFGLEGEIVLPFVEREGLTLLADLRGDYVRATLDDGTPIPRTPPLSLLGALEVQTDPVDARVEVQYTAKQDRVAPFETPTDAFTFVNASLAWKPLRGENSVRVLLKADNIFDVTGRRHASFTKDFVPLTGRNFKVSLRASF